MRKVEIFNYIYNITFTEIMILTTPIYKLKLSLIVLPLTNKLSKL